MGSKKSAPSPAQQAEMQRQQQIARQEADPIFVANRERPDWEGIRDQKGNLKQQFQLAKDADITIDQRAQDAVRQRALSTGDSPWANLQLQKNQMASQDQKQNLSQQNASSAAQARSNLAMRGGISGGARERLGKQAMMNQMLAQQQVGRDQQQNDLNVRIQDDSQRTDALKTTMQADQANANMATQNRDYRGNVDLQNRNAAMMDVEGKGRFDLAVYKDKMAAYGASKTADAQKAASGGGGKK